MRTNAACAALGDDERVDLARMGRAKTLARGETLFHAGDPVKLSATLTKGLLKLRNVGEDGSERVLSLIHPAGFVGELFGPMAQFDIVAVTDSELCLFSRGDYEQAIGRFPALAGALLFRTAEALQDARALLDLQTRRSARQKVAAFVLAIARAASHSPCHPAEQINVPLSRGEMAALLGLTIETASRQISALERDGLIARGRGRGIRLTDPAALERLVS